MIPEQELLGPVKSVKNKAVLAMALIMFFGIIIIYLGMQLNYNPVRKLISTVEKRWGQALGNHHGFEKVASAIEYADEVAQVWKQRMEDSKPAVLRQQLTDLLKGRFSSWAEFNEKGRELGIVIPEESYSYILILQFEGLNPQDGLTLWKNWFGPE